jgi:hypothetical protein
VRLYPIRAAAFMLAAAWLPPDAAEAAGGAHVVDDAEVEDAGLCHLELWAIRFGRPRADLINAAPACTFAALPRLELGGAVSQIWADGEKELSFGPAVKVNMVPVSAGVGVGLAAALGFTDRKDRAETASLLVPLTTDLSRQLRLNVNLGWVWTRTDPEPHSAFWGAQLNWDVRDDLALMGEAFGRDRGRPGYQGGVRWVTLGGTLDVDLLAAHRLDGVARYAFTLGLTLRR